MRTLEDEIQEAQRQVKTDAYQMSIGEIVNMYNDDELIISPDFQRLFRWEPGQKSKLIESILLGIPLPPIFVYERMDSSWELVDGLQRVSTILEFMGLLKDPDSDSNRPPSFMLGTKYLPSLRNVVWEKSDLASLPLKEQEPLDKALRLSVRRARIGVEILKRPSDSQTKYDLFQRLNAGGTQANAQELRNCIIIMVSDPYFKMLQSLAESESFRTVIRLTEKQVRRQRHMEWATRFLVHRYAPYEGALADLDVEDYFNEGAIQLATKGVTAKVKRDFLATFDLIEKAYGNDSLCRMTDGKHQGGVGLAAYEGIALGVAHNLTKIMAQSDPVAFVKRRIRSFWKKPELDSFYVLGLRGTIRIQRTIPFGIKHFAP